MVAIIQGFLKKRAIKSGKNWKRRYFVLTDEGILQFSDRKGGPVKGSIQITQLTSISVLRELKHDGGICITGPDHSPLYLQAESREVAEGWIQAMEVIKAGGSNKLRAKEHQMKGDDLKDAFVNKEALGGDGRGLLQHTLGRRKGTLDRKNGTLGRRKGTLKRNGTGNTTRSTLEEVPRPPPGLTDEEDNESLGTDEDYDDMPPPMYMSEDEHVGESDGEVEDLEDDELPDNDFGDGFIMRVGKRDYFVDATNWNYYKDRAAFINGKKPIGRAVLANLV